MNYTEQEYEHIGRYLNNQLTITEKQAFEERLRTDPDWATEVALTQKLIVNYRYLTLKDTFAEIRDKLEAEEREERVTDERVHETIVRPLGQRSWGSRQWLAVAASLVLMLGIGYWALRPTKPDVTVAKGDPIILPDTSQSSGHVVAPPPNVLAMAEAFASEVPQRVSNVPGSIRKGATAYENGDLSSAIAALDFPINTPSKPPVQDTLYGSSKSAKAIERVQTETANTRQYRLLYLGLSQLKAGRTAEALASLQAVKLMQLKPIASWYEALCLVQLKKTRAARTLLVTITQQPQHPYLTEATALLEAITPKTEKQP